MTESILANNPYLLELFNECDTGNDILALLDELYPVG